VRNISRGVPLYVRFNPHYYTKEGVLYDQPLPDAHAKLLKIIRDLQPSDLNPGLNLIYVNYDQVAPEGGEEPWRRLRIFQTDNPHAHHLRGYVLGVY